MFLSAFFAVVKIYPLSTREQFLNKRKGINLNSAKWNVLSFYNQKGENGSPGQIFKDPVWYKRIEYLQVL
jgi:hypothetical protein